MDLAGPSVVTWGGQYEWPLSKSLVVLAELRLCRSFWPFCPHAQLDLGSPLPAIGLAVAGSRYFPPVCERQGICGWAASVHGSAQETVKIQAQAVELA